MKKTNFVLGALALIMSAALVFTGCNHDPVEPEVTTYTVTFDTDGGSKIAPVTVEDGATVAEPETPTKEGYDLEAWLDGETAYDFSSPVVADLTLKAKWAVKKFTVTFDINEGTGDVAAQTVEYGAKATAPETDPTLAGSNFIAWTTTKDDAETTFDFDTVIKSDVTLYAYYSADPYYTVKFMNGETVVATKSVKEGTKTTAPEDVVKKGYTFEGWFADTTKFDAEAAVTANATYTAKLTLDTYTITYVLNDGTNYEGAPTSYTVESETIVLGTPTKAGYDFVSWYSDEANTDAITEIAKGSVDNITLYAKFLVIATQTYTTQGQLKFDYNGGDWGSNFQITVKPFESSYEAKKDDVIRIHINGIPAEDISNLKCVIIDNSIEWTEISDWEMISETLTANTKYDFIKDVVLTKDAVKAGGIVVAMACDNDTGATEGSKIIKCPMPTVLKINISSLSLAYNGGSPVVNEDGTVTAEANGSNPNSQYAISLGGGQDLSNYKKMVIEYKAQPVKNDSETTTGDYGEGILKIGFLTSEAGMWGGIAPEYYGNFTLDFVKKEINLSEVSDKITDIAFIGLGHSGCKNGVFTIKSITLYQDEE